MLIFMNFNNTLHIQVMFGFFFQVEDFESKHNLPQDLDLEMKGGKGKKESKKN